MGIASPNGNQTVTGDKYRQPERPPEFVSIPADALVRHRGRLLDPSTAVWEPRPDPDAPPPPRPLSTAYRADTLLIPLHKTQQPGLLDLYNKALQPLGYELKVVTPKTPAWERALRTFNGDLQVPVLLVTREDRIADRSPDPWAALVTLRQALRAETEEFALEHLVTAASLVIEGVPYTGGGLTGNDNGHMGGISLHTGSRNPVRVMAPRPKRTVPASVLPSGRRPVVAVLDTGIGEHPWLTPVGDDLSADPVVEVSQEFQTLLADHEVELAAATGAPVEPLGHPWEVRDVVQPLLGLTDSHSGHGTFITGLIHQGCPDARVLSLRVLHSDGLSTTGSVLLALEWLRDRVQTAINKNDHDKLVDVVSLSLGFYPESNDAANLAHLTKAIDKLTSLGVVVVAAAGNDSTTRPFMPAGLGATNPMLAAVGALNASGETVAAFSNEGDWVRLWAPGDALVSTVPIWQGSQEPGIAPEAVPGRPRRSSPDPDDLRTGFAVWAGTSFATPVVAGMIAAAMACDPESDPAKRNERADRALSTARAELQTVDRP